MNNQMHEKNARTIKRSTIFRVILICLLVTFTLGLMDSLKQIDLEDPNHTAILSLVVMYIALIISTEAIYTQTVDTTEQYDNALIQSEKEQKIRHIETSLEKFYVPLLKMLTDIEENANTNDKQIKINEIMCYVHLVKPDTVRNEENILSYVYYMAYCIEEKKQAQDICEKLLKLVKKDIKDYQKEYKDLIKK